MSDFVKYLECFEEKKDRLSGLKKGGCESRKYNRKNMSDFNFLSDGQRNRKIDIQVLVSTPQFTAIRLMK